MHHRIGRLFLFLLVFFVALSSAIVADEESETFVDEIDVRVVNLEVRVTDKKGKHIAGLQPSDFVLEIDGEEMPIGYFSEIRDRLAVDSGEPSRSVAEEASSSRVAEPSVVAGERVRTSYLLFIDDDFGLVHDRRQVLDSLLEQVAEFDPHDQMAIVSYDGRRLHLVTDWTSSVADLEEALLQAKTAPAFGLQRLGERSAFDRDRTRAGSGLIADGDSMAIIDYVRRLSRRIEGALDAASSALRGFSTPTGRKVMLLASGGWPRDPSTYAAGFNPNLRNQTKHYFPDEAFDELVSTANLLGYTLYPIDVPGNKVRVRGITAEGRGEHIPGLTAGYGASLVARLNAGPAGASPATTAPGTASQIFGGTGLFDLPTDRETEIEATLIELAKETGGRAMTNSLRLDAFDIAREDTASYYWLGFTPTRRHDDRDYEIRVKVREDTGREKLKVRSRRSFRDFSRRSQVAMKVESNLIFDKEVEGGQDLRVEVGTPQVKRRVLLPVSLTIPLDAVVMLPNENGFEARLELRIGSINERGDRSELPVVPVQFGGPHAPQPGQEVVYDIVLKIRNKSQRLVMGLHDLAGDAVLTTSFEFEPPS